MKHTVRSIAIALVAVMAAAAASAAAGSPAAPKQVQIVKQISPSPGARAPGEDELAAYLLVYFKDETHAIYFATSTDGRSFTDINHAQPILSGAGIAEQKGVRDPHIMRGPDGAFYMAMTDLHIYAQKEGLRETEWERPREQYGWGNNRALIFMKSFDLIHWTHALVHVGQRFPAYADIGAAWAPQTIFDPQQNKLMVYFTLRIKGGHNYMAYSYADQAFTGLSTEPQRLFTYPDANKSTIDGDIIKVGNQYHLHYVAHDTPGGLRHAVSDKINSGYRYDPAKVDPETVACEAPMVWRLLGSDKYVLMYDVFGAKPNNMGFSETSDFVAYKNLGRFNDPGSVMKASNFSGPKHGTVMHITAEELKRLHAYFGTGGA